MVEEKEVCIKAGKTAGGMVHFLVESVKKTGKFGEKLIKTADVCVKKVVESCDAVCARADNFMKRVGYGGTLAAWEEKQKDVFTRIGEKVFNEKELKQKENPKDIIEDWQVKELLQKAKAYENRIQEIKDDLAMQKEKMDLLAIISRAEEDLKSEDPRVRRVAIRLLEKIGTEEVIPMIESVLEDPDAEVRQRAAEVLERLKKNTKRTGKKAKKVNPAEITGAILHHTGAPEVKKRSPRKKNAPTISFENFADETITKI